MRYYLLIEWAGARWIWMSSGAPPADSDASLGACFDWPGWAQEATGEPPADTVTVDLAWDGVARLVAMGHRPASAAASMGWLEEDAAWEDRRVLLSGSVSAEYGGDGELVTVRISARPWTDAGLLLADSQSASEATWASVPASTDGRGYPLPIGRPGEYQAADGSASYCSATPCLPVATDTLLVACARVTSSTVTVYSELDDDQESFSIDYSLDDQGQTVATVDLSAATSIIYDAGGRYWARWPDGGLCLATGEILEQAGDVIAWALRQSSLKVDAAALEAIRSPLAGFILGGFLDSPVSPWEWLTQEILPLLPVFLLQGPRGIRPVLWRAPSAPLAIDLLSVDRGEVARDGRITETGDPLNDLTIRYAWRARTGDYLRSRRIAGSGGHLSTDEVTTSYRAFGRRVAPPLQTEWVYRTDTADRILLARMAMLQPRKKLAVVGSIFRLKHIRPLDCVLITDSDLYMTERPALVRRVEWSTQTARLILEV